MDIIPRLQFHWADRTPSWKRYGGGWAEARFDYHTVAKWLEIEITEATPIGTKKTASVCLSPEQVAELLNLVLGKENVASMAGTFAPLNKMGDE